MVNDASKRYNVAIETLKAEGAQGPFEVIDTGGAIAVWASDTKRAVQYIGTLPADIKALTPKEWVAHYGS